MSLVFKNLTEKILKIIIIFGSFLVVLIPVVIVPESYFPYIIQKTIILRIIVEVIFGAYVILVLFKPEYRPRKSIILWSVLAFAGVMLLTTLTSQSVARSWWGNWERMFGTFTYLHYFAWYIALISVFNSKIMWNRILNFSLFVSLLISLYSLSQRFSLFNTFEPGLQRVNGTMGNASFLATYLLFHLFIALLFIIEKKGLRWKLCYFSIFIADLFVLLLTGTRGALLALIASIVLFVVLVFWFKIWKQKLFKYLLFFCFLIIICIGVLFIFKDAGFVKGNYWFKRITNFSIEDNTIQTRLHSWSWGMKGFRDNLLFGVGPENYQIVFNQYFEGDFYDYSKTEIWFDRAHNTLVDMASTMGILGLLSYLGIFIATYFALFNFFKKEFLTAKVFIILVLLFFTYFFQNIFVFDSLNSLIIFYLVLAFITYLSSKHSESLSIKENNQSFSRAQFSQKEIIKKSISPAISMPLAVIFVLVLLFKVNIPEIKANNYVFDAFIESKMNRYDESMRNYDLTYDVAVNRLDTPVLMSTSANTMIATNNNIATKEVELADLNKAIKWMDEAIELDPENMFLYYIQSKNYSLLSELTREVKYIELGIKFAEEAHRMSPNRVRPLWMLGQLYLFGSQPEKALMYLGEALKKNQNYSDTYFYKAVVYQNIGDEVKMYEMYNKMIDLKYEFYSSQQILNIIPHYEEVKDLPRLEYLLRQLTQYQSDDPNVWNSFVNVLVAEGNYQKALGVLQEWANAIPQASVNAADRYQEILNIMNNQNNEDQNK